MHSSEDNLDVAHHISRVAHRTGVQELLDEPGFRRMRVQCSFSNVPLVNRRSLVAYVKFFSKIENFNILHM